MILLVGLPGDPPMTRVGVALEEMGVPFTMLDQRRHADIRLRLQLSSNCGELGGELKLDNSVINLSTVRGVYTRLHGEDAFPDVCKLSSEHPDRVRFRRLVSLLTDFADLCPGTVLNRSHSMATNNSKGYQSQLIRACGFDIPKTLITNNVQSATDFIESIWSEGKDVIFKSVSSVRSIVRTVDKSDIDRLNLIRVCPVQFQERVEGTDIRVHVVGESVIATSINTTGTDYRYAAREQGGGTELTETELPENIASRCIQLAAQIGLGFAGVDLRRTDDSRWVCFEVNPSPAFSYYESHTGQAISAAVAQCLASNTAYLNDGPCPDRHRSLVIDAT